MSYKNRMTTSCSEILQICSCPLHSIQLSKKYITYHSSKRSYQAAMDLQKLFHGATVIHSNSTKQHQVAKQKFDSRFVIDLALNMNDNIKLALNINKYARVHVHIVFSQLPQNESFRRVTILFVLHNLEFQGAPLVAYRLIEEFVSRFNFTVDVIAPQRGPLAAKLAAIGVNIYIQRTFPSIDYDIIYINTIVDWFRHPPQGWLQKTIWWVHESMPFLMTDFVKTYLPLSAHRIFVTNKSLYMYPDSVRPLKQTSIIANMADFVESSKAQMEDNHLGLPIHAVTFTQVGTVNSIRGQLVFAHAAVMISKLYKNARFLIVGNTDQPLYASHIKTVTDIIRSRFRIVGGVDQHLALKYIAGSDVLISLSRLESFGMTLLEAMSLGKPIIVAKVDGVPDVVYKKSINVEPTSILSVFNAMEIMLDSNTRQRHGFFSIQHSSVFSIDILRKHVDVIHSVMSARQ